MSAVINGVDVLEHNAYLAIAMGESLGYLLDGKNEGIPKGVLLGAKNLFSAARTPHGEPLSSKHRGYWVDPLEEFVTYDLLADMLKRVKNVGDPYQELRKLAAAVDALNPDGKEVTSDRKTYETLRDLFIEMHRASGGYVPAFGEHSPYSVGTFDDSDE